MAQIIDPIKVDGLRDFQRALRTMEEGAQKQLRVTLNVVADVIRVPAQRLTPTRTGAARTSIRLASGQREVSIKAGGRKAPYFGWLDYGGRIGPAKSVRRPFIPEGRILYPAFKRNREAVLDTLGQGLADLARHAGLDVS